MVWGAAFAWASMAVPACRRIWSRVKLTISYAMSVSRMRLSDAERFSVVTCRLAIVDWNRFWSAPSLTSEGGHRRDRESTRPPAVVSFEVSVTSICDSAVYVVFVAARDADVVDRHLDLVRGRHVGADLEHTAAGVRHAPRRRSADRRRGRYRRAARSMPVPVSVAGPLEVDRPHAGAEVGDLDADRAGEAAAGRWSPR